MSKPPVTPLPTTVRIPTELRKWLDQHARKRRQSMSQLIVWVLEQYKGNVEGT